MILNCRVVAVLDRTTFSDGQERIVIEVKEADTISRQFRVVNAENLSLGNEFRLVASIGRDAAEANAVPPGLIASGAILSGGFVDSKPAGYISKGSGA